MIHLEVPRPDRAGRAALLQLGLDKLKTRRAFQVEELAMKTEGFSGAELAALCREAGLQAIQRGIAQACEHFLSAVREGRRLSAHDALETHRLCERIVEAAEGHQNINGLLKFGLTKNLELRFGNNPIERDAGVADMGDSGAGFKYKIFTQKSWRPTASRRRR